MRLILNLLLIFSFFLPLHSEKLAEKWDKWLNEEVVYIISKKEREVFLSLQTDKEREKFVENFWLIRDPTPGTPANEFKDEHYRRLEYANKVLGRGSTRPGWMTDMGRVYIILGEPLERHRFETYESVYPVELWYYHGEIKYGFPPYFYIMFYKEHGIGDWKIYSPAGDGPEKLLNPSAWKSAGSREEAYKMLKRINSELASASLTLIPGEAIDPSGSIISLSSDLLLNNVFSLPAKKVESAWAEEFLKIKDFVLSDYSVNYVKSDSTVFLQREGSINLIHFSIEPEKIVFNQYEKKVYAPLKINIRITDLKGNGIYQEERDVSIEMGEEKFKSLEGRICAIQGVIPIVPGDYILNILLRNVQSKDFSSLERTIHSPFSSDSPSLSSILIGFGKRTGGDSYIRAFKFKDFQLFLDSKKNFTPKDNLVFYAEIYNFERLPKNCRIEWSISSGGKVLFRKEETLQNYILGSLPLNNLSPDYYRLRVSVIDASGKELMFSTEDFSLLPIPNVSRPWIYSQSYQNPNQLIEILMEQLINKGESESALKLTENIEKKGKTLFLAGKAKFLLGDFKSAIDYLLNFKESNDPSVLSLLAKSYEGMGSLNEAIFYYEALLKISGGSIDALNSLGNCYFKLGKREEAKKYFERSLKLNPDQKEIIEILKKL